MALPRRSLWLFSLALLLVPIARAEDKPCTGRQNGRYYDLSGLKNAKDYTLNTVEGHEMVLSACRSVESETWGLKAQDSGSVGGFVRLAHGDFSMGQTNTTLHFPSHPRAGHPHLTLTAGSKCRDSNGNELDNLRASTEIEFICDPAHNPGHPRLVTQLPPGGDDTACAWVFEWRTAAACPKRKGPTFDVLSFLFGAVFGALVAYLLMGTLYNYYFLGLSGTDVLPPFTPAGALRHWREANALLHEWSANRQAAFNLSSSGNGARGPEGLNGPGGFPSRSSATHKDPETAAVKL